MREEEMYSIEVAANRASIIEEDGVTLEMTNV
jgi:hypothetical protein